jgi:hypothetical protein
MSTRVHQSVLSYFVCFSARDVNALTGGPNTSIPIFTDKFDVFEVVYLQVFKYQP